MRPWHPGRLAFGYYQWPQNEHGVEAETGRTMGAYHTRVTYPLYSKFPVEDISRLIRELEEFTQTA
jgi:hypothetical protein